MNLYEHTGINQAELCRRLGLHQNTVSKWKGYPPQYARAYLEVLAELVSLKETLRELGR